MKATPITYKACKSSALKQTYNQALVDGARASAKKFQSYEISPDQDKSANTQDALKEMQQTDIETPQDNTDDVVNEETTELTE